MSIRHVRIRNFRSIREFDESIAGLTILVGRNDVGKSNILRALNLFFNHNHLRGYELDWAEDYCSFARKGAKQAEEIVVEVAFEMPSTFTDRNAKWKKVWRKAGLYLDEITDLDGYALPGRSKTLQYLRALRYDYVPAIKGGDYFQSLMAKLHDMLETTVEEKVREAAGEFTRTITVNTKDILRELKTQLGLKSSIEPPKNMRDVYARLEFTSVTGGEQFSLSQRGDGIKVRHIPIILNWLAEQANALVTSGRPRIDTIWGYEEPENNLEMTQCLKLAEQLIAQAGTIQALVTTHSPAFYSVFRDADPNEVQVFEVLQASPDDPVTTVRHVSQGNLLSLDGSMGLMSILAPHIRSKEEEIQKLQNLAKNTPDTNLPTVFCEGPSDRDILLIAMREFYPKLLESTRFLCSARNGGGHNWVKDMIIAWHHLRPVSAAVGIFDWDDDAEKSRSQANTITHNDPKAKTIRLTITEDLKQCRSVGLKLGFALEEIFDRTVWDHAERQNWLEDRTNAIMACRFSCTDVSLEEYVSVKLSDAHLRRMILKKFGNSHKEKVIKFIRKQPPAERRKTLQNIRPTLEEALEKIKVL